MMTLMVLSEKANDKSAVSPAPKFQACTSGRFDAGVFLAQDAPGKPLAAGSSCVELLTTSDHTASGTSISGKSCGNRLCKLARYSVINGDALMATRSIDIAQFV